MVRYSRATRASITLRAVDGVCHLDVVDDGVGMSDDTARGRLEQGHIGIASQRTRIEAAGGAMRIVPDGHRDSCPGQRSQETARDGFVAGGQEPV